MFSCQSGVIKLKGVPSDTDRCPTANGLGHVRKGTLRKLKAAKRTKLQGVMDMDHRLVVSRG